MGFVPILDGYNPKIIWIVVSRSLLKNKKSVGLNEFCNYFSLNLVHLMLIVSKEQMLLLFFSTDLEVNLPWALTYGFLALILLDFPFFSRHWPIFQIFSSFCPIITLLKVHIILYWHSKKHNWYMKVLKVMDYGLNGFYTSFSKISIEFFLHLSLTVVL